MARTSTLTLQMVERAISTLELRGEPVTWHRIRKITGTGSDARIKELMAMAGVGPGVEPGSESDPVLRRMAHLLRPVVLELNQEMEAERQEMVAQAEEQVGKAKEELEALQQTMEAQAAELAREQSRREELESLAVSRRESIFELEKSRTGDEQKISSLNDRLDAALKDVAESKDRAANLESRLEHQRQASGDRLVELQEKHQGEINGKNEQIRQLLDEKGQLNTQLAGAISETQKQAESLGRVSQDLTHARRRHQAAEEALATAREALEAKLADADTKRRAAEERARELEAAGARYREQMQAEVATLAGALADLRADAERESLTQRCRDLEGAIEELQQQLEERDAGSGPSKDS